MLAPVLRLAVLVIADTLQVPGVDAPHLPLDTLFNDVFRQGVEDACTAFRQRVVQSSGPVATAVVAFGNLFREVVPVLLQAISGVEVGVLGAVCDGGEVVDFEVDTRCFIAGSVGALDFVFADEVVPPAFLCAIG